MFDRRMSAGIGQITQYGAALFMIACVGTTVLGQAQGTAPAPTQTIPATSPSATPVNQPTPIPLADLVTAADSTRASLAGTVDRLSSDQSVESIQHQLSVLIPEIDARLEETNKIVTQNSSLDTLRSLEADWQKLGEHLPLWRRELTGRAVALEKERARLDGFQQTWAQTLELARNSDGPPEIVERAENVFAAINHTRQRVDERRTLVLTLQGDVAEQQARISQALASVRQARDAAVNRLLVRDSPPIWSREVRSLPGQSLVQESENSFSTQLTAFESYAVRESARFLTHIAVILSFIAVLFWARNRVHARVEREPDLKPAIHVFDLPFAVSVALSILISTWIYPQAPRLLWAMLGAAALIPTTVILRRLLERHLFPVLNALVVFYFIDLLRYVTASLQLVTRFLLLAETIGGLLFLFWLLKSLERSEVPGADETLSVKVIRAGVYISLPVFAAGLVANVFGYVNLASFVVSALLGSAYLAVVLYGAIKIFEGLVVFALRVRPLSLLGMVRENRRLVRRRVLGVLRFTATLLWAIYTLELLSLRVRVFESIRAGLTASLTIGSLNLSLGNVLAFGITIWAAFLLSKFIRFLLEEDVYTRVHLAPGLPYAISTMLHYTVLLLGFFAAVAAVGFDMTRFTILAGAFGVGLGFGLQNIVNNFVSGIIVLFERPVKVGDAIQMGDSAGIVKRIGIRASVIRMENGSDVIVPNGKLISDTVINWSLSIPQREISIPISIPNREEPLRVIESIKEVAREHPLVTKDPEPEALLVEFTPETLKFELHAWTNRFEEWARIRSDLSLSINAALMREVAPALNR